MYEAKAPGPRTVALLTGLVLGLAGAAVAAQGTDASAAGGPDRVSRAELEKFAAAYSALRAVRAEYRTKIRQAEHEDQRAQLRREGRQALAQAIRDEGLRIARYKHIGRSLQHDEQLRSRLREVVRGQAPPPGEPPRRAPSGQR